MLLLLLCALTVCLLFWWTADVPELWIAVVIGAPILQLLI